MWFGVPLCVVSVQIFWALNEVSRELEDPFLFEPYELPLSHLHSAAALRSLLRRLSTG